MITNIDETLVIVTSTIATPIDENVHNNEHSKHDKDNTGQWQ